MHRNLLLLSTSTVFGTRYLEHAAAEFAELLTGLTRVLFVPWALQEHATYTAKARVGFAEMGVALDSIHEAEDAVAAVEQAQALFVGGGNTFRLLKAVQDRGLVEPIRRRVAAGMPYSGASAGSNLACPTLKTTNDMPIVQPASFEALALVGFQINPHYFDPDPTSRHMGETRETRIREFHEENAAAVVGLREGAFLRVRGASVKLGGATGARLFRRSTEPLELEAGAALESLIPGA